MKEKGAAGCGYGVQTISISVGRRTDCRRFAEGVYGPVCCLFLWRGDCRLYDYGIRQQTGETRPVLENWLGAGMDALLAARTVGWRWQTLGSAAWRPCSGAPPSLFSSSCWYNSARFADRLVNDGIRAVARLLFSLEKGGTATRISSGYLPPLCHCRTRGGGHLISLKFSPLFASPAFTLCARQRWKILRGGALVNAILLLGVTFRCRAARLPAFLLLLRPLQSRMAAAGFHRRRGENCSHGGFVLLPAEDVFLSRVPPLCRTTPERSVETSPALATAYAKGRLPGVCLLREDHGAVSASGGIAIPRSGSLRHA